MFGLPRGAPKPSILAASLNHRGRQLRTCVRLGARAGACEEVDIAPDELQVLQPILGALRAPEAEHGRPRLDPADVHLHRQPGPLIDPPLLAMHVCTAWLLGARAPCGNLFVPVKHSAAAHAAICSDMLLQIREDHQQCQASRSSSHWLPA